MPLSAQRMADLFAIAMLLMMRDDASARRLIFIAAPCCLRRASLRRCRCRHDIAHGKMRRAMRYATLLPCFADIDARDADIRVAAMPLSRAHTLLITRCRALLLRCCRLIALLMLRSMRARRYSRRRCRRADAIDSCRCAMLLKIVAAAAMLRC